jgi:hypothetical protein
MSILSFHLLLGLAIHPSPYSLPTKILIGVVISFEHATCPAHIIILEFFSQIILGQRL